MRFSKSHPLSRFEIIIITIVCYILFLKSISVIIDYSSRCGQPKQSGTVTSLDQEVNPAKFLEDNLHKPEWLAQNRETIHLATVAGGYNSSRTFYTMLKSILFYRRNPIHLHLFVDGIAYTILSHLFNSWPVDRLEVDYYNVSHYEHEIGWIPNQHYSQKFGFIKLVILSVLEEKSIEKVILFDTDMLCLGNIGVIWDEFKRISSYRNDRKPRPVFGLVENQSDWYLSNSPTLKSVWPAIGRGFNSGLLMVDLAELKRSYNWRQLWRQVTEIELASLLSTPLADQDIFNAVIRRNSHMIYTLPCNFNIQLNDHAKLDEVCPYADDQDFRLIHWNSPYKQQTKNPVAKKYQLWYETFVNWNGNLFSDLRPRLVFQQQSKLPADPNHSDQLCQFIRPRASDRLRSYLFLLNFDYVPVKWDVTMVVHLSFDRFQVLNQIAANWRGPISAAIYIDEMETSLLLYSIEESSHLATRKNIAYHLVFRDFGFNYPINRMRNVALNNSVTDMVFLSDVDFIPSQNLYDHIRQSISNIAALGNPPIELESKNSSTELDANPLERRALVIPAFETVQYKFEFPRNKAELVSQLNLGSISIFRQQLWPQGHAPTDYSRWKQSTTLYKVDWKPDYEPFIVTSRKAPKFDERFIGFGWNKVERSMKLAALEYEFIVLPEAFLIHQIHSASYDILKHRESTKYRACIRHLRRQFIIELDKEFPRFFKRIRLLEKPQPQSLPDDNMKLELDGSQDFKEI